ncbi:unnamed protein product [Cylicocyclus nassatus]|uniref:Uncharacterized protein n=1 Tax=Cylicocyclus nassatus TaxID=53992 RepID=A0AA36HEG2_CYLNA|nr:unnamed protein product [Cylicocyclus nassatus]
MLLLILLPLIGAQNPYGPSQLDQYVRLLNSGNLGGFGFIQNALAQGTVRGLGDLNPPPLLAGLPPLPLTYDEVMEQLTSTSPPPTTRATAKPTTPSSNPGGVYAVNNMVEMPPMPENRLHGTFDEDGVFHPDNNIEKSDDEQHIVRNQIQGTKIREFSQAERDTVDGHQEVPIKEEEYSDDQYVDDPPNRRTSAVDAHKLAEHGTEKKTRVPRQNYPNQRKFANPPPKQRRVYEHSRTSHIAGLKPTIQHEEPRYPPFVFRPKPPPPQREPEYNNLLAEIEEYDDFLEQQRVYRSRYPQAIIHNPYRDLPAGQLPSAANFQTQIPSPIAEKLPAPRRVVTTIPNNNWPQVQQQWSAPQPQPHPPQPQPHPPQPQPHPPQLPPQPQPQNVPPQFTNTATEHPILNFLNLFSPHHAHALAAPQVSLDDAKPATSTSAPRPNPYQFGMMPFPAQGIPLVNIQQQPLTLFPRNTGPMEFCKNEPYLLISETASCAESPPCTQILCYEDVSCFLASTLSPIVAGCRTPERELFCVCPSFPPQLPPSFTAFRKRGTTLSAMSTTTSAPTENPIQNNTDGNGLSGGAIAAIIIGVILFLALLGVAAFFVMRKIRDRRRNHGEYRPQFEELHHAKDLPYLQPPAVEGLI